MIAPSPSQWQASRRFLDYDGGEGRSAAQCGDAAASLHDRLRIGLAPLVGAGGFDALFARSVHLGASGFVGAAPAAGGREQLKDYLAQQEPVVAAKMAAAVFADLFALLTTLIGEKLTDKILLQVGFPISEENDK